MNPKPIVSFCSTVYNNANRIKGCLESLLEFEKYNIPFEIVIVDNYSTDGTWEILQEYKKKYPEIFRLKRYKCNRGLGRYISVKLARGDVIVTFDCDTYYTKEYLQIIYSILKRIKEKELYCLITSFVTKASSFKTINFRPFNWGEDADLMRQAIKKGFTIYTVAVACSINEEGREAVREKRYVKNKLKFIKRMSKNLLELVRIRSPSIREGINYMLRRKSLKKALGIICSPLGLLIKLFKLTYYSTPLDFDMIKMYYEKRWEFLFPSDFEIDEKLFLFFTHSDIIKVLFEIIATQKKINYKKYYRPGLYIYLHPNSYNWIKQHILRINII